MATSPSAAGAAAPVPLSTRLGLTALTWWPARRWLVAAVVTVVAALAMGVPTGIVETSFCTA